MKPLRDAGQVTFLKNLLSAWFETKLCSIGPANYRAVTRVKVLNEDTAMEVPYCQVVTAHTIRLLGWQQIPHIDPA